MAFLKKKNLKNLFKTKDIEAYETLQKRIENKKEFLEKIVECFNNLKNCLNNFSEKANNLNTTLNNITFLPQDKIFHDTAKSIYIKILNNINDNSVLLTNLIKYISDHTSKLDQEVSLYLELKKINKEVSGEKEKLKKIKETYHKVAKEAEEKIMKNNITNINQIYENEKLRKNIEGIASNPKKALNNYRQNITKTNKIINTYNEKRNNILVYLPKLAGEDGKLLSEVIGIYLKSLENENKVINKNKNEIKNSKSYETNNELEQLIGKTENNNLKEEKVNLIQYVTGLDLYNCQNQKDFEMQATCMNIINIFIDNEIFPNYNYDIESKNYKVISIINQLFKEKGEIDSKLSDNFLKSLNDPSLHDSIFIKLSKLRTKGNFKHSKYLIELLGKAFIFLANYAGKNNLFNNFSNVLILSQTYYYEDDNKNKIYISDYLKNNKIIYNTKIWRNFIDGKIDQELKSYQNKCNLNKIEISSNNLDELTFSMLLSFIDSMKDFKIDKRVILKIIDESLVKFKNVYESNIIFLYEMITEGKDSIETIRKEYDSSLENELFDDINITNIEEDKKEDEKENIKIEKKEENNIENEKK